MIELPFALPTAVAGIALTSLTADTGLVGKFFARFGIQIAYTRVGITVALVFVGIPFVVRSRFWKSWIPLMKKRQGFWEPAGSGFSGR